VTYGKKDLPYPYSSDFTGLVSHIKGIRESTRAALANSLKVASYLKAGVNLIEQNVSGMDFKDHSVESLKNRMIGMRFLSERAVSREVAELEPPFLRQKGTGPYRSTWASHDDYLSDLLAFVTHFLAEPPGADGQRFLSTSRDAVRRWLVLDGEYQGTDFNVVSAGPYVRRLRAVALGDPVRCDDSGVTTLASTVRDGVQVAVVGGGNGSVSLWDLGARMKVGGLRVSHNSTVTTLAILPESEKSLAVTGAGDGSIRVWSLKTGIPVGDLPASADNVTAMTVSVFNERPVLITGDHNGKIQAWDVGAAKPIAAPMTGHTGAVEDLASAFVNGRHILVSGGEDQTIRVWDVATLSQLGESLVTNTRAIHSVAITAVDGRLTVVGGGSESISRWNLATRVAIGRSMLARDDRMHTLAVAMIGGYSLGVTGSEDGTVRIWDLTAGVALSPPLAGHQRRVVCATWIAVDGRPVAVTGSIDGTVQRWEIVEEQSVGASLPPYRSDSPNSADRLARSSDATALAELITARSARPPLAVGLFGDWGEGKSHFLGLLQREVEAATTSGNPLAHHSVRQVRFNAWHYAESDLWASLVTELFGQLAASGNGRSEPDEQRRQSRLAAELLSERGLPQRLAAARKRRDELRTALRKPQDLWASLPTHQQEQLRVMIGDRAEKLYAEAARVVAAVGESGLQSWQFVRNVKLQSAIVLFLTIVGLIGVAGFAVWWLPSVGRWIATAPGILIVLSAAQTMRRLVIKTRQRGSAMWQTAMRIGEQQRERLAAAADAADAEVTALRRELQDSSAAGQLAGLVADRNAIGDYRSRLTMMSKIRQDFAHMSRLLAEASAAPNPDEAGSVERPRLVDEAGDALPQIDRIIVYIDDLDRCTPRRVVEMLEAVHLLLAVDLFVVVVAVDPRWLLSAISAHHREVLDDDDPSDSSTSWTRQTAVQYLEKIFQLVLTLPPLNTEGYQRLLNSLLGTREDDFSVRPEESPKIYPAAAVIGVQEDNHYNGDNPVLAANLPSPRLVERIDPFALDRDEIKLLDLLGPPRLLTTPRQVTRLANSYGLLTVLRREQRAADLKLQTGRIRHKDGTSRSVVYRPCRAATVLLASLVAYPSLGPDLFLYLRDESLHDPHRTWEEFLFELAPRATSSGWKNRGDEPLTAYQARQWQALFDALREAAAEAANRDLYLPEPLVAWAEWIVPVGRLSFPTGRVISTLHHPRRLPVYANPLDGKPFGEGAALAALDDSGVDSVDDR
jgi:WD40 repeat protein